jgi:putative transposase
VSEVHEQAIVLKLYPNRAQADLMRRFGGATRWLWNHLLAANKARYEAERKFIFRYEMQDMLPAMKKRPGLEWLCDAPAASFQRIAQELDVALKNCFRLKRGFPRFKSFRDNADRFYVSNQQIEIVGNKVKLPKLGLVRFRSGRVPTGKIAGSVVRQEGPGWVCAVQFKAEIAPSPEPIVAAVGIDLGCRSLATLNAGLTVCQKVEAPKPLRKALKRLRRQQRAVSRSGKRSTSRARKVAAGSRASGATTPTNSREPSSTQWV